jgi:hypothetical protein
LKATSPGPAVAALQREAGAAGGKTMVGSTEDIWRTRGTRILKALGVIIGVYVLVTPFVMAFEYLRAFGDFSPAYGSEVPVDEEVIGLAYVDAILYVYDEAMHPWLPNDRIYPSIFLDNPQNFQVGVLTALQDAVRILRDHLTRDQTADRMDPDVQTAFTQLSFDPGDFWILPPVEREYEKGMDALKRYRERLTTGSASFRPRADNLVELLNQFNSRLGGVNNRLHNCIGAFARRLSEETATDPNLESGGYEIASVPWMQIDDQFYYAQGVAFVQREIMNAIRVEFREILGQRNADHLARQIVVDFMDYSQFEPIYVANGGYGSMWANHPYQLLALLSQTRERTRSLVTMMDVNVR